MRKLHEQVAQILLSNTLPSPQFKSMAIWGIDDKQLMTTVQGWVGSVGGTS